MIRKISLFVVLFTVNQSVALDKKYTQQEYISMWKEIAISQMNEFGIPASITLAQGILESSNGNSDLAQKANNHFGIKCGTWNGKAFYKDDTSTKLSASNSKGECYRSYNNAKDSYIDHSNFLKNKQRYAFLFNLDMKDYKSWANGLQKAGYATNPKYPQLLIDLIERLNLNQYDESNLFTNVDKNTWSTNSPEKSNKENTIKISRTPRKILTHTNDISYVVAGKGDTYYRLSKELDISLWQLYKYNEFGDKKDCLTEGDIIYLEPKKRKSFTKKSILIKNEISLRDVSQTEGIKLKRLMKFNQIDSPDEPLQKGSKIYLK